MPRATTGSGAKPRDNVAQMRSRWLIALVLVAGCKQKARPPEPAPSVEPASGSSVTKVKPAGGSGKALDGVTAISVGDARACAIAKDDKLWCWAAGKPAERVDAPGSSVLAIANAACAILDDKSVWCWPHRLELIAADMPGAGQISASATDVCASRRLFVWCWRPDDDRPRMQFDWAGVDRLVIGNGRACSVVSGGEIECTDLRAGEHHPQRVDELQDVAALAMQGNVSCVAYTKGEVECWTDPKHRHRIPGLTGATDIALGTSGDACVLNAGGGVTCWKLGMSSLAVDRPPAPVTGVTGTSIGVGTGFACALGDDQKARCWSMTGDAKPQVVARR
jgi:hypothetical protein